MTSHRCDPSDCTPPAKLARLRNEVIVPRSPITRYRLDADRIPNGPFALGSLHPPPPRLKPSRIEGDASPTQEALQSRVYHVPTSHLRRKPYRQESHTSCPATRHPSPGRLVVSTVHTHAHLDCPRSTPGSTTSVTRNPSG
jgi:hypothetical protein